MLDNNLFEYRVLTPAELARIVISTREQRGWSQETLAEFAGRSLRTIQRVEKGNPSDLDTRRSLAKAFEWSDIDIFNKPWPLPNEDKIKEEEQKLNETTTLVALETVSSGKLLRHKIEGSLAASFHEYTELPEAASAIFAELQDYMKDYMDICSDFSAVDKLNVNKDFQDAIDKLREMEITLGVAIRQMSLSNENWENKKPMPMTVIHVVSGSSKAFPQSIRLPKKVQFA